MFGTATTVPVPDLDRTDYLLMLGANPLASNGSLMTAPDVPRPAAGDPGPRRQARRHRPAPHAAPPRRPTSTTSSAPAPTRYLLFALVHVLFDEGLVDPGAAADGDHVGPRRRAQRSPRPSRPRPSRRRPGSTPTTIRRIARELAAAPTRRRLRPDRHLHAGVRHARAAGSSTCSTSLTGNLDREGGAMFPLGAAGHSNAAGAPGTRPRRPVRPLAEPRARTARDLRRAAGRVPRRGDRDAGRGSDAGADHGRRQPGRLDAEQRPARRGARAARLHGQRRRLRQRDDAPRRRDPAGARRRCAARTTTSRCTCSRSATSPTTRRRVLAAEPELPRRVGDAAAARRRRRAGSGPTPTSARSTSRSRARVARGRDRADDAEGPRSTARSVDASSPSSSGCSTSAPHWPVRRCFGAGPDGLSLAELEANPHGIDLGPLKPRLPDVLRTASGKIELAPELIVGDVERLRASLDARRGTASSCSSAAASCARTTRGCTTSRCS